MKYLKQKTSGVFYYRRAVPTELRDIIGKKEYGFSLKTKDKHIALERYVAADKQAEALFSSYSVDAQKSEKGRVAALGWATSELDNAIALARRMQIAIREKVVPN